MAGRARAPPGPARRQQSTPSPPPPAAAPPSPQPTPRVAARTAPRMRALRRSAPPHPPAAAGPPRPRARQMCRAVMSTAAARSAARWRPPPRPGLRHRCATRRLHGAPWYQRPAGGLHPTRWSCHLPSCTRAVRGVIALLSHKHHTRVRRGSCVAQTVGCGLSLVRRRLSSFNRPCNGRIPVLDGQHSPLRRRWPRL